MDSIFSYQIKKEEDFYTLLGCDELSSTDQIVAEYKQRALECHPDKHPNDPSAGERFACLHVAKETLCDEGTRKLYDTWRRCGMAMSYKEWCARKDSLHTSLHWAMKKKKEPMLEGGPSFPVKEEEVLLSPKSCGWQGEIASCQSILSKFRNYQI